MTREIINVIVHYTTIPKIYEQLQDRAETDNETWRDVGMTEYGLRVCSCMREEKKESE